MNYVPRTMWKSFTSVGVVISVTDTSSTFDEGDPSFLHQPMSFSIASDSPVASIFTDPSGKLQTVPFKANDLAFFSV